MITEDEFYDAVDATLDKLEKEEEKVISLFQFSSVQFKMVYALRKAPPICAPPCLSFFVLKCRNGKDETAKQRRLTRNYTRNIDTKLG